MVKKIYEIRLNDEKRKLIRVGDFIVFRKEPALTEEIKTEIKDLIIFNSFDSMVESLSSREIGFDNSNKKEIVDVYHQFYSKEDEQKFGVLAIKLDIIN